MKDHYEGIYRIARNPVRMKSHNAESWKKVSNLASTLQNGEMSFSQMCAAVKNHSSGSESSPHPYQFIIYCIKSGWLERM